MKTSELPPWGRLGPQPGAERKQGHVTQKHLHDQEQLPAQWPDLRNLSSGTGRRSRTRCISQLWTQSWFPASAGSRSAPLPGFAFGSACSSVPYSAGATVYSRSVNPPTGTPTHFLLLSMWRSTVTLIKCKHRVQKRRPQLHRYKHSTGRDFLY